MANDFIFIKDLKRLKFKVLVSAACLGDMIQDEKKLGNTKKLKEYKRRSKFWALVLTDLDDMIQRTELLEKKENQ